MADSMRRIAQSADNTERGMTTTATNLLKSASERRAERERERAQLDSKTSEDGDGERRREGGREGGRRAISPSSS